MAEGLLVTRRLGERKPITTEATYPEAVDLSEPAVTWWQRRLGTDEWHISAGTATVTDISESKGQPAGTVWEHRYAPSAAAVGTPGRYACHFRQDYGPTGDEQYRYVPDEGGEIRLVVVEQPVA